MITPEITAIPMNFSLSLHHRTQRQHTSADAVLTKQSQSNLAPMQRRT